MTLRCQIVAWLKGCKRLAVLGIGNPLRGDDAVGMEIVKLLKGRVPVKIRLFECETMPENFLDEIELFRPTHVLMIDAAHLETEAGEARLVPPEKIAGASFSTHAMPLSILVRLLQEDIKARVMLLGVQPRRTDLREELSPELRSATERIANIILEATRCIR